MKPQDEIVERTAREIMARLAPVPADTHVRVAIGRPGLSVIAPRPEATAPANGMAEEIHDDLPSSLRNDR